MTDFDVRLENNLDPETGLISQWQCYINREPVTPDEFFSQMAAAMALPSGNIRFRHDGIEDEAVARKAR